MPLKPTLVTGASGFVGWHVARLLIERGHRVRALVRGSEQHSGTRRRARHRRPARSGFSGKGRRRMRARLPCCGRLPAVVEGSPRFVSNKRGRHAQHALRRPRRRRRALRLHQHGGLYRGSRGRDRRRISTGIDQRDDRRVQALEVSRRRSRARIRARRISRRHRESNGAHGRSRFQTNSNRADRAGLPEWRATRVHRYRAQCGQCA